MSGACVQGAITNLSYQGDLDGNIVGRGGLARKNRGIVTMTITIDTTEPDLAALIECIKKNPSSPVFLSM